MRKEYHFTGFLVILAFKVMRRSILPQKQANILVPYVDFKKQMNDLLKCKWQSELDKTVNNKLHEVRTQLGLDLKQEPVPEGFVH